MDCGILVGMNQQPRRSIAAMAAGRPLKAGEVFEQAYFFFKQQVQ
jgi:hypothetical protein